MFEISEQLAKEISEKLNVKEIGENWSFKVVASDETIDRAGEVIKISWWELWNFMKNPVIIANHIYKVENIIGKATNVYMQDDKLIVEWVFAETELAQDVRKLYDGWFIKTVSVGFIPKERDAEQRNIITKAELLEVSFVPVPCNPNALSLGKEIVDDLISKGLIVKEEAPADEEKVEETTETPEDKEVVEGEEVVEETTEENEEKSVSLEEVLAEVRALRSEIKDFISNNRKEDDNSSVESDEEKDAKIKMQKEALQNVSKVVSDCLHKIKL